MVALGSRIVFALLAGLCCGLSPAVAQGGRPIKVGAVSALSGGSSFPESSRAARAYFDAVNAQGGLDGRRIEYISLDERMSPAVAAEAARWLVSDPEVVALAGSSGVLDCAVNRKLYENAGIMSLQGGSVAPECFTSPNIVPMNNGPYTGLAGAVLFAQQTLRARTLCVTLLNLPGMVEGYRRAMERLADQNHVVVPELRIISPGEDPVPVIRDLAARRCDVAVYTGHESAVLEWMAAAAAQRVKGITWVFLTPAYTAAVAKALAASAQPVYAMSEFEPWSSRSLSLTDWRQLMRKADLPLSSLSQGGYMSAQILVRALRHVSGPISRASVTQALRNLPIQETGLVGMPFLIGNRAVHNPNRTTVPMQLQDGAWRIAAAQWITVPEVLAPSR